MPEPITTTPHDRARGELRRLSGEALLALMQARETREDGEALEEAADGLLVTRRPYVGCDALALGDLDAPPSPAEERAWRLSLAFLELEGLAGLEYESAEVCDAAGGALRVERLARLTKEGDRQALAILRRWSAEATPTVRQGLAVMVGQCAALALNLEPPEDDPARAVVDHGRQLLADVRQLLTMLEAEEAAHALPGVTPAELTGLVAVGEDGTRVYAADVWAHVKAKAAEHSAAMLEALEQAGRDLPAALGAYAFECLNLAHLLGASLNKPEEGRRHA